MTAPPCTLPPKLTSPGSARKRSVMSRAALTGGGIRMGGSPGHLKNELHGPAIRRLRNSASDAEIENPRMQVHVKRRVQGMILLRPRQRPAELPEVGIIFRSKRNAR